jgi:hypothetical protein
MIKDLLISFILLLSLSANSQVRFQGYCLDFGIPSTKPVYQSSQAIVIFACMRKKNQKYTQAEMYTAIERCHSEDITYSQYCNQAGIHYATFKYWTKKYQQERTARGTTAKAPFVPHWRGYASNGTGALL